MTTNQSLAAAILSALGGVGNVDQIDPCTTRLRSVVKDPARVDAAALRAVGAYGVMISGNVVQVVVGPHADNVASDLADLM
jgi:PTS system N-acetylglucosamine-specific IIB component